MQNAPARLLDLIEKQWSPLSDRIVIIPDQEEKTSGSIIVADVKPGQSKKTTGFVIAVGKGRVSDYGKLIPMEVEVGSRYLFKKYAGDDVLVNDDGSFEEYTGDVLEGQTLIVIARQESILTKIHS